MSRPNAALSLPPGDRDDAPPTTLEASPAAPIAGREPDRVVVELHEQRAAIIRRMATRQGRKRWPYAGIGEDLAVLRAATTRQLVAEIAADKRATRKRTPTRTKH